MKRPAASNEVNKKRLIVTTVGGGLILASLAFVIMQRQSLGHQSEIVKHTETTSGSIEPNEVGRSSTEPRAGDITKDPPDENQDVMVDPVISAEDVFRQSMLSHFAAKMRIDVAPLPEAPENALLRIHPTLGETFTYRTVAATCNEEGNLSDGAYAQGFEQMRTGVIQDANDETKTYTVGWTIKGRTLAMGGKETELMEYPNPQGDSWTENCSYSGRVESSEGTGTSPFTAGGGKAGDFPQVEYPQKAVKPGTSWKCVSQNKDTNFVEAEVLGYARVNGRPCVSLKITMHTQTRVDHRFFGKDLSVDLSVDSHGTRYIDLKEGIIVAEDLIVRTKANSIESSLRSVTQLIP